MNGEKEAGNTGRKGIISSGIVSRCYKLISFHTIFHDGIKPGRSEK